MRWVIAKSTGEKPQSWRLLLWATLASLACGLTSFVEPVEDQVRNMRNMLHPIEASGEIVFVGVDDRSLSQVGRWPWSRSTQADLIAKADAAGARQIFLDMIYDSPGTPKEDADFERVLAKAGNVVLADRAKLGPSAQFAEPTPPLERFTQHAGTASITVFYNYQNAVWQMSRSQQGRNGQVPPFAVSMSNKSTEGLSDMFRINYRIDPLTVPYISAGDLLAGRERSKLAGKTVIIGLNADQLGDQLWIPSKGRMAGAYVHILGAETLKRGAPTDLGWLLPLLTILGFIAAALAQGSGRRRAAILAAALLLVLIAPFMLEKRQVYADVMPGLLTLLIVSGRLIYLRMSRRALVNEDTQLPNLAALRTEKGIDKLALIVARVHNQNELSATLGDKERHEAIRQIVSRLNAPGSTRLFHIEDATFAWLLDPSQAIGNHLEALHALFRTPVSLSGRQIDVALTFGVELGSARSINNRLGSAVLAADEAWTEGLRWKLHDPSRQEEMNWRVSLLGELDAAIDHGEVWLAYQPQYDIRRDRIVGAEALARWTHPQKGPISPTEFVAAAENNGRIAKLTDFVLDRAIGAAAAINRRGVDFQVAVNLSARLLSDRDLLGRIERMLDAHGLHASKLTLELTETATLQDAESGLATLDALRRKGVRVAIDDYGTGLSTLDYLKKIPANEIKIDQSFVKSMRVNRSDLIMVQSTIALAHSLGRTVVAEGVEDKQCLDELTRMGCDMAQGFAIGRPMGVRELIQRLQIRSARKVA
ncbi:EAL domain-containing protein [Sphingomonas sp. LHG3406-1]|uniref:EAL domain-containing protein n=1 Tax=Sphingomonas sp. LHG3406-1 TaxID=2804617 RepID=UPI002614446C|nr:EAL domain-containing protein [Sphingomonas sp. LHG3406-1]